MAASAIPGIDPRTTKRRGGAARRAVLAALALSALGSPAISAGCAASFDAPSKVNALRILAVTPDKPYAAPGDEVTFKMTFNDGYVDPVDGVVSRPVLMVWLGGCYDPPADQYFGCYEQLGSLLKDAFSGSMSTLPDEIKFGPFLDTFKLKIPEDIVSRRPKPDFGPHYGIAYLFFLACAGASVAPVLPDGTGKAPDFPLGCFDADGNRLGPESFVPGYTQIYSFADGRTNANPMMAGMKIEADDLPEGDDFDTIPIVAACPLTDDERRSPSCSQEIPASCEPYDIKAIIDPGVAELDPDATGEENGKLTEAVWISYFADRGDIAPGIKLVNDAVTGFNPDLGTQWLPPAEPGIATVWAVLRDARGGSSVLQRFIRVEP